MSLYIYEGIRPLGKNATILCSLTAATRLIVEHCEHPSDFYFLNEPGRCSVGLVCWKKPCIINASYASCKEHSQCVQFAP